MHIDGTLSEQHGGGRDGAGGQPETATVAAGTRSQALEGGAVGQRAGADQFGADGVGGAVAAGEDGIAAVLYPGLIRQVNPSLFLQWKGGFFK